MPCLVASNINRVERLFASHHRVDEEHASHSSIDQDGVADIKLCKTFNSYARLLASAFFVFLSKRFVAIKTHGHPILAVVNEVFASNSDLIVDGVGDFMFANMALNNSKNLVLLVIKAKDYVASFQVLNIG